MNKELLKDWRADVGLFCMGVCLFEVFFDVVGIRFELIELKYLFLGYGIGTFVIAAAKSYYKNI